MKEHAVVLDPHEDITIKNCILGVGKAQNTIFDWPQQLRIIEYVCNSQTKRLFTNTYPVIQTYSSKTDSFQ